MNACDFAASRYAAGVPRPSKKRPEPASAHALAVASLAAAEAQLSDKLAQADALRRDEARQVIADLYRTAGSLLRDLLAPGAARLPREVSDAARRLTPRQREVLDRLLLGDGEKQAAAALGISRHTLHDYAGAIYGVFGVSSRAELMARFVHRPA